MNETSQMGGAPYTFLKLIIGLVVGVGGGAVLIWTDTSPGSLSVASIGLSFVFGLLVVFADYKQPLGHVFERGRWLMIGIAILFLLAVVQDVFSTAQWIGLTFGFSGGLVLTTVGIGTKQLVSQ